MKGNDKGNTEVPEFFFVSVNVVKFSLFPECPENREKRGINHACTFWNRMYNWGKLSEFTR